jgi:hypothetical protein
MQFQTFSRGWYRRTPLIKGREGKKGKGAAGNLGLNSRGREDTGRGTRMKRLLVGEGG